MTFVDMNFAVGLCSVASIFLYLFILNEKACDSNRIGRSDDSSHKHDGCKICASDYCSRTSGYYTSIHGNQLNEWHARPNMSWYMLGLFAFQFWRISRRFAWWDLEVEHSHCVVCLVDRVVPVSPSRFRMRPDISHWNSIWVALCRVFGEFCGILWYFIQQLEYTLGLHNRTWFSLACLLKNITISNR